MRLIFFTILFGLVMVLVFSSYVHLKRFLLEELIHASSTNSVSIHHRATFSMKDTLSELQNETHFREHQGIYNPQALQFYKQQLKTTQLKSKRREYQVKRTHQFLYAGHPDSSIRLLKNIYAGLDQPYQYYFMTKKSWDSRLKSEFFASSIFQENWGNKTFQLGLCYLRKGEQMNCQTNHNHKSCILPFDEPAIHINKSGSKKAIQKFSKTISNDSDHLVAEWLLNIAYMTIGKYPDQVPSSQKIDFSKYSSEKMVNEFTNIAGERGVNTLTFYGGACMEDFNEDGYLDLFTTSADLQTNVTFYINDGEGGFTDRTEEASLKGITGGVNAIHGDYNNDGYEDIYVIRGGWMNKAGEKHPNSLLRNNGDGTFTDVTQEAGLLSFWASHTACWGDIDNDGNVDLFVGNERGPSHLFINEGDGSFKEIAKEAGLNINEFIKGATWLDYDKDGDLDLYTSSYVGYNHLFENVGSGNRSSVPEFKDVTNKAGVSKPFYSFPVVALDFNNDGHQDLFCADFRMSMEEYVSAYKSDNEFSRIRPSLYINNGDGTFTDKWKEYGDARQTLSMSINVGDINSDGFQDIYLGTGYPDFAALVPNLMYLNQKGNGLTDVTNQGGFGHLQKGHGISFGDLNQDGDQDIYMNVGGWYYADQFYNVLFENPGHQNNWVVIELVGQQSNRSAIGSKVKLTVSDDGEDRRTIWRTVSTGGSFGSSGLQLEVGLGNADQIDELKIFWPGKEDKIQVFDDLSVNQKMTITEGHHNIHFPQYDAYSFDKDSSNTHHHHLFQ